MAGRKDVHRTASGALEDAFCKSYDDDDDDDDDDDAECDDDEWWTNEDSRCGEQRCRATTNGTATTTDAHGCDSRPERGHVGRGTGGGTFVSGGARDASGTNGRRGDDESDDER